MTGSPALYLARDVGDLVRDLDRREIDPTLIAGLILALMQIWQQCQDAPTDPDHAVAWLRGETAPLGLRWIARARREKLLRRAVREHYRGEERDCGPIAEAIIDRSQIVTGHEMRGLMAEAGLFY